MTSNKKLPNPIDVHVGSRVRLQRTMLKISQEKLGAALGVTFQQVQKYEKGTNRIGASRMQKISQTLNVPVSFFFEGLPGEDVDPAASGMGEGESADFVMDFLSSSEGIELNRSFIQIDSPAIRRRIIDMVRTLANEMGDKDS